LRLLHPFMPFITEELWQRLPRRPDDKTPSIMVSAYPLPEPAFVFPEAERDFDLAFSTVKAVRSLAAQYGLMSNIQTYIHINAPRLAKTVKDQAPTIVALTKGCKSVEVVEDKQQIPLGCGSAVVNADVTVHILVRGIVDLDAEIAKAQKKLDLAESNASKVRKLQSQVDYETAIPEQVREGNAEKLRTLLAEIVTLQQSKDMFTALKG